MKSIFKNLIGNTLIFAIGNGTVLLVSFFMIPFYTAVLSTTEFGITDLMSTTVNMLLPIISLNIFTAVFRWSLDEESDKSEVFSNGFFISGIGSILSIMSSLIFFCSHLNYAGATALNLSAVILLNFIQNFFRGTNNIKLYASSGAVGAGINAILSIVLMIVFKFGLIGYIISLIISNYFTVLFLFVIGKSWLYWSKDLISYEKIILMLRFSAPMIPNAFTWWMTNDISRIIILVFVGPSGNGLYAVANKLPSMMFTVFSLFQNAWQISSVKTAKEKEAEKIYSITFNAIVSLMIYSSAVIVCVVKIFMENYVDHTYYEAWKFIPILLITSMLSNISGFLGTTYTVAKETKGLFTTTIWGTIVNLVMCFTMIPLFGVQGAAISGSLGFLVVSIIRLKQTTKWIKIKIKWRELVFLSIGYFFICLNVYFYQKSIFVNFFILFIMSLFLLSQIRKLIIKKNRN